MFFSKACVFIVERNCCFKIVREFHDSGSTLKIFEVHVMLCWIWGSVVPPSLHVLFFGMCQGGPYLHVADRDDVLFNTPLELSGSRCGILCFFLTLIIRCTDQIRFVSSTINLITVIIICLLAVSVPKRVMFTIKQQTLQQYVHNKAAAWADSLANVLWFC